MGKFLLLLVTAAVNIYGSARCAVESSMSSNSIFETTITPDPLWYTHGICEAFLEEECIESLVPQEFPGAIEEMEHDCSLIMEFVVCANRTLTNCNPYSDLTWLFEFERIFKRLCDKDDVFYYAIMESSSCLKSNEIQITSCPEFSDERMQNFVKVLADVDVAAPDTIPVHCLEFLYGVGCAAATTDLLCGDVARDLILNLVLDIFDTDKICSPNLKEKIFEITKVMQMEAEKEKSVDKTLKRKKREARPRHFISTLIRTVEYKVNKK